MFERFTDRARRVLVLAQEEAQLLDHAFIGTEHILLGLLHEGEGVGAKALTGLGLDLATIRSKVEATIGCGEPGSGIKKAPFTPRAKKVLELSLREALNLGHNYIGTEHQLLGLIREGEGVASQVLLASGLQPDQVRAKVIELLEGYSAGAIPGGGAPAGKSSITTPAGTAIPEKALAQAATAPLGTHHYLLAMFDDPNSLGARVLESLGVTRAAVVDRIAAMGVPGTTDEMPRPEPAGGFHLALGDDFSLRIDDATLAAEVRATIRQVGDRGEAGELAAIIRKALADWLVMPVDPPSEWVGKRSESEPSAATKGIDEEPE